MANLSKGKGREDVLTDADKALQVYRHELQCKKLLLADRRMCLSIGIAVGLDGHAIANHKLEEERAARDRQIALAGTTILPRHCDKTEMEEDKGLEEIVARFASLNTFVPNALSSPSEDNCGEASCSRSKADTQEIHDICIACAGREIKTRLVRGPCLHAYCTDCIKSLFEAAITDESLFPPSCCRQRFSLSEVKSHLPNDLVTRFEQKSVELATPNRTYCAVPLCSTFIPLKQVEDDNAVCQKCSAVTCTTCKQLAHGEGDCPNDDSVSDFLQVAKEAGWQRCRKCKRMVELDIGCNHIRYDMIHSRLTCWIKLMSNTDASVAQSSVMSAGCPGRPVNAINGMKTNYTNERTRSWVVVPSRTLRLVLSRFIGWEGISDSDTNAITQIGDISRASTSVRNATKSCLNISSNVVNAAS